MTTRRSRTAAALLLFAVATLVWAAAVAITGGVRLSIGPLRLSSRELRNPLLTALVAGVTGSLLLRRDERLQLWRAILTTLEFDPFRVLPSWFAPAAAGLAAIATTTVGVTKGALVAAGADVYGYISQAHLWTSGWPRVHEPLLQQLHWPYAVDALAPLGYTPGPDHQSIVPVYSIGLPLVMAVFERVGGPHAAFYTVPVLGGVAVFSTYLLGARIGRRGVGLAAALLLATSPAFVFQLMLAMSDVPVTAWWALALALLSFDRRSATFGAGIATSLAILTRPNLVVGGAALGLWLAWFALKSRSWTSLATTRLLCFVAGVVPGCLTVGIVNLVLYGSPLESGYGRLGRFYAWRHILPNISNNAAWMWQSQTPLIFVGVIAVIATLWRRPATASSERERGLIWMWTAFAAAIFAVYLPYDVFDNWFWLRFVLPAWPSLLTLAVLALVMTFARLPRALADLSVTVLVLLVLRQNVVFLGHTETFNLKHGEQKSVVVGRYIAEHLPERAIFLAVQQSGSVRYYANRMTLRFDTIPPNDLDRVVSDLRRLQFHPYVVIEEPELSFFVDRFQARSRLALLDWAPVVETRHEIPVKIFDLVEPDSQRGQNTVRIF